MIKIAPSILAADYLRLGEQIDLAGEAGADWLHFDVMDGRFVPNIGFGQEMLKAVSGRSNLPLDVHLMVEKPDRCIETFAEAGASIITIHAEVAYHLHRMLHRIRELGCKAGVALNPSTPPECLRYVLGDFDLALVMTVNPGYGGQKLIPSALKKVSDVRKMLAEAGAQADIEVDGGVCLDNVREIADHGATVLVTGSAFFRAADPAAFVRAARARLG